MTIRGVRLIGRANDEGGVGAEPEAIPEVEVEVEPPAQAVSLTREDDIVYLTMAKAEAVAGVDQDINDVHGAVRGPLLERGLSACSETDIPGGRMKVCHDRDPVAEPVIRPHTRLTQIRLPL